MLIQCISFTKSSNNKSDAGQNAPAILLIFMKLPFVIKIFILSIFLMAFYTGFTVWLKWTYMGEAPVTCSNYKYLQM